MNPHLKDKKKIQNKKNLFFLEFSETYAKKKIQVIPSIMDKFVDFFHNKIVYLFP